MGQTVTNVMADMAAVVSSQDTDSLVFRKLFEASYKSIGGRTLSLIETKSVIVSAILSRSFGFTR